MNKNEILQIEIDKMLLENYNENKQKQNLKYQYPQEYNLYNNTYFFPTKQNINSIKINNYIQHKNNNNHNNNNREDQRLIFCLKMLGLFNYYPNFLEKGINFQGLLALTHNDMTEMNIPINSQKVIQNFSLDYLYFGSQYTLEELKKYFLQKKTRINSNSSQINSNKRSYSCDFKKRKTNQRINSQKNNNNFISDNTQIKRNLIHNNSVNSKRLNKSISSLNLASIFLLVFLFKLQKLSSIISR
jgi:hypothetical protein